MLTLDIPPLRERLIASGCIDILRQVAARQRALMPAKASHINQNGRREDVYETLYALSDVGLLNLIKSRNGNDLLAVTLTTEGWQMVGGKPLWL